MSKPNENLITQAVLMSFEKGIDATAPAFDLTSEDLRWYQQWYLDHNGIRPLPAPPTAEPYVSEPVEPVQSKSQEPEQIHLPASIWEKLYRSTYYDVSLKVGMAFLLILICWKMPFVLAPLVDPLTNTVIWMGFTAAYLTLFAGLVLDMILWVQHPANFNFLNPLVLQGSDDDYQTLMYSDKLTAIDKCRLNQQKYLAYLFAYCAILIALASLTTGATN